MDDFIAMGFDEDIVNSAFKAARGNKELAMEILLGEAPSIDHTVMIFTS